MLFLLMVMYSASLQVLWMWAACILLHTFQRTFRVSGCKGQRTKREVTKLESNTMLGGGEAFGGYPIPQEKLANTKMPCQKLTKCRYRISFRSRLLKVYPSCVFVHLKHLCTSNQPQPLWGNVRWPRIQSVQRSKRTLYQFHLRLSVKLCNHLPLIY